MNLACRTLQARHVGPGTKLDCGVVLQAKLHDVRMFRSGQVKSGATYLLGSVSLLNPLLHCLESNLINSPTGLAACSFEAVKGNLETLEVSHLKDHARPFVVVSIFDDDLDTTLEGIGALVLSFWTLEPSVDEVD